MPSPTQVHFVVMRDCCTSGNCFHCTGKTPYGVPMRVEHAIYVVGEQVHGNAPLSEDQAMDKAKAMATSWAGLKATVERVEVSSENDDLQCLAGCRVNGSGRCQPEHRDCEWRVS